MKYGDAEFYACMDQFESGEKKCCRSRLSDFTRVPRGDVGVRSPAGEWYANGETNAKFHAFLRGYALAKAIGRGE